MFFCARQLSSIGIQNFWDLNKLFKICRSGFENSSFILMPINMFQEIRYNGCLVKSIFVSVVVFVLLSALNYSGFCFKSMRYINPTEKIKLTFEKWNKTRKIRVNIDGKESLVLRYSKYKDFEDFLSKNPNCCKVNPKGSFDLPSPSFLDRVTGYHSGETIVLEFFTDVVDKSKHVRKAKVRVERNFQNCGEIKW